MNNETIWYVLAYSLTEPIQIIEEAFSLKAYADEMYEELNKDDEFKVAPPRKVLLNHDAVNKKITKVVNRGRWHEKD